MTTDITELAQRMRIAATMASQGAWSYARSGFNSIVRTSANLPSGGASRVVLCKLFRSEWRGELKTAQDAQFIALANPANVLALVEALERKEEQRANWFQMAQKLGEDLDSAEKRIAELEREQEHLRPVGVMSEQAFHRLENSECRFIALWPRPGIFLPRKRPEDGVIVYARTAAAAGIKVEAE